MANGHRVLRPAARITAGALPRLLAAAGIAATIAGCSARQSQPARLLQTEDFIAEEARSREVAQTPVRTEYTAPETAPVVQPPVITRREALEGIEDVTAVVGSPCLRPNAEATPVRKPVLIDAKIGEINGRPVRVNEVLLGRNLEPAFIAKAAEPNMTRGAWLADVQQNIRRELEWMLQDELLRAEALASLKPEQRMGLRYIVQEMSEDMRRQARGSRAEAERRLREEGKASTFSEMERKREAQLLVDYQLQEKIRRRVRVSWKDVRLYYERNFEVFNPPAEAYLRLIRVPANRADDVARIQAALDAGTPFEQVARLPENTYNAAAGGAQERPITFSGNLSEAKLEVVESMATTIRTLSPGEFNRQPIEFVRGGGNVDRMWIYLDSVRQRNRPLSDRDVQREIADLLSKQLTEKEIQLHISRLMERASFTDLETMTRRLVEIAADRYWPQQG